MTRRRAIVVLAMMLGAAPSSPGIAAAPADPWLPCRERLARSPDDYESAYCFYAAAVEHVRSQDAIDVFEALLRDHPDNLWLPLAYGHLHRSRGPGTDLRTAEVLYRRAADGFRARRHAGGEIVSRISLRDFLAPQGRIQEATAQMARVAEIGATVSDPVLKAQVATAQASHVLDTGGDLGHAYRLLKQAERAIFPVGPYRLQRTCATWLGLVAFRLGRLDEAIGVFQRLDVMARAQGDVQSEVTAQYNILNAESARENLLPTAGGRERLMTLARAVLAVGTRAANRAATLKAHRVIAELTGRDPASRGEALHHANRCLELAAAAGRAEDEALCSWLVATLLHPTSPRETRQAQLRALVATERANNPATDAVTAGRSMQFSWLSKPRSEAIRDSMSALAAIETLRNLQDTAQTSAEVFSIRTPEYYWLSGRLLRDAQEGEVDLAFAITERLKSGALMALRTRTPSDPTHPAVVERQGLLREIATIQRRLMDPTVSDDARQSSLKRLEALEEREESAARLIALSTRRGPATPRQPASLGDVQAALAPGEALLSFQVGTSETPDRDFGGGSWLIAVTTDRRWVYRIPDRSHFAELVPVFSGLLSRGDGVEEPAAAGLYGDVFSEALRALPPEIDRLVLVPDGPLHDLPFEALRPSPGAAPLGQRYEIVLAPSATLWLDWRRHRPAPSKRRVLALADPAFAANGPAAAERHVVLEQGVTLGRLPHARRESRTIRRVLGDVDTFVGPLASEHVVKTRTLREYEIVHFAAHAVADEERPDRSAVFLAPGSADEDGLLQGREIAELDLGGRIVVLSACRTASGAVLTGEGVLSLARAFFAAGARAVVGTRWPIRDDHAAALFESFYRHLAQGASLSSALKRTRTDAMANGLPASVWAGLVLIGDGSLQPFPGGSPRRAETSWRPALVLAGSILAIALVMIARRRR